MVSNDIEGKCIVEGYVKKGSIKIISFSSGIVIGDHVKFDIIMECLVCCPVEGMNIKCIAKNITKAGIRAETEDNPSPVVIFIARDHHYDVEHFSKVSQNDKIQVRVIGQRYELNDTYVSIIAELVKPKKKKMVIKKKSQIKDETS